MLLQHWYKTMSMFFMVLFSFKDLRQSLIANGFSQNIKYDDFILPHMHLSNYFWISKGLKEVNLPQMKAETRNFNVVCITLFELNVLKYRAWRTKNVLLSESNVVDCMQRV